MPRPVIPLFPSIDEMASRPALRVGDELLDYAALGTTCALFRRALAEVGIDQRDRIAVWARPELDSIVGLIGSLAAGVTTVPLNPDIGDQELAHILADAKPKAIFSADPERDRARTPKLPVHSFLLAQRSLVTHRLAEARTPNDPLLVLYTSGTTGAPKGAVLSATNIAATLDGLERAWALSPEDTLVHALPLFHAHGLVFGLLGALRVGACLHFLPKFTPQAVARALSGPRRVLYAVPTMYRRLVDAAEREPEVRDGLAAARLLVSGSAPLPAREHARIEAVTGQRVCERYGLSETLVNTAVRHDGERRPGYVGVPLDGVEVKLVDDARAPVLAHDDETIGEIAVRGPNVFLGYLNRPDATLEVLDAEGWFHTGDLGTLAPDGYLRIVGRKATDLIKTGGFKVGAGEVEAALHEHPSVSEAAVVGLPDEDLGERIVAFVVPRAAAPEAATLIDHVATLLAKHKRPREVRFVSALPRNALGKVLKKELLKLT
ncbi:MAG: putative fatty acid synthase [Myxococcaceae bacterium]|nr:putative fatty acid synthase [Myxococcaceae bacterium]